MAEETAQGLKEALESWGSKEESQVCITTDNGSNVVKAASQLVPRLREVKTFCA